MPIPVLDLSYILKCIIYSCRLGVSKVQLTWLAIAIVFVKWGFIGTQPYPFTSLWPVTPSHDKVELSSRTETFLFLKPKTPGP